MRKRYKVSLSLILLVILGIIGIIVFCKTCSRDDDSQPRVVDSLDAFEYTLEDRDTALMKETYNELKDILDEKEIDMEEYAKSLTKLFIIDLFTMENKQTKYDVGGAEYIYPEAISNYKINVEDTLYKTMEMNNDGKRKQNLPVVKSVDIDEVKKGEYTIGENDKYNSYIINASWDYEKDLGYDKEATITCIEKDNRIYIVEYAVGE